MNKVVVAGIVLMVACCSKLALADTLNGFDIDNLSVDKAALSHSGPRKDTIPALNKPRYLTADKASFLDDNDIVFGLVDGEQSYAYPRHILNWHSIVNEKNFVIVYCPLCGSGMAFDNRVAGKRLRFGVSSLLYNSAIVMFDRQTKSLWSQMTKTAIAGPLVNKSLIQRPLEVASWLDWKRKYRRTWVLSESQGYKRNYRHPPYPGYQGSELVFFDLLQQAPTSYHNKEWVLGIEVDGVFKAYPYAEMRKLNTNLFADEINGEAFEIHWDRTNNTAYATKMNGDLAITTTAFWFAWFNFHPQTLVFRAE